MAIEETIPPVGRHCGACTACCTHLPMPEGVVIPGAKPAGVACPYVEALGCRNYARRPRICAEFHCAWLRDTTWPGSWRPDRSGLLCLRETLEEDLPAAAVYEILPGALERPGAAAILDVLRECTDMTVVIEYGRQQRRVLGKWAAHAPAVGTSPHYVPLRGGDPPVLPSLEVRPLTVY